MSSLHSALIIVVVSAANAVPQADVQSLIQSHLHDERLSSGNESENATAADDGPSLYKITYLATHGADHACLSEIQFLDMNRQFLQARLQEQSSCYGCPVKCDECRADWGDASRQFDMVSTSNDASAWSCTGVGSFIEGVGVSRPHVIFTLKERPAKVVFASAETGGWTPKSWIMEVYQHSTARWEKVAEVEDREAEVEQGFFVLQFGTAENPAKWPIDYEGCGGKSETPLDINPTVDPPSMSATFTAEEDSFLAYNGQFDFDYGHGMAIDGEFGTITVGTTAYVVRQLTFQFPSKRRGPDGNQAEGEMHIIMQKVGSLGIFDLAVVAVMLQLKEEGAEDDSTRDFFLDLGLEELPRQGEPKLITKPVDLSPFTPLIQAGNVEIYECSQYVPWYILGQPAYITGTIQKAFLDGPSEATPAPTFFNQTLVNMTEEQKAMAYYANGMNPDGTPLLTEEEKAAQDLRAAGPSPRSAAKVGKGPAPPGATVAADGATTAQPSVTTAAPL